MNLGAFSVSLTVADLEASRTFYERLGFEVAGGEQDDGWLILRNGFATIGLFHGMFDKNILTFNPGLGQDMAPAADRTDVREVQRVLEATGIAIDTKVADDKPEGPGHIVFTDPDGNVIMIDQFD
jgi:catechol 2,3-dioxygenase-like lactoylglutathione lyase family enzyme